MPAQPEFQQRLESIEDLLGKIESAADPSLRTTVQELVAVGDGSARRRAGANAGTAPCTGDRGSASVQKLGRDELVGSLLVLYGLHPLDLEARVGAGAGKGGFASASAEGEVELLSIQDGAVRLRLHAEGHGCGSTAQALKEMVEEAVYQAAPDVTALMIEGAEEKQGFVPLEMLRTAACAVAG